MTLTYFSRPVLLHVKALLLLMTFYAAPAIAQDDFAALREKLDDIDDIAEWAELCEITDCAQFPVGYNTYVFGPQVYHFPMMSTMTVKPPNVLRGGVKAGRFIEFGENDKLLRSLSISGSTSIPSCCHHLLTFFGLADAMPTFREDRNGNKMPSAFVYISSFDQPHINSSFRKRLGYDGTLVPPIGNLLGEDPMSYNDDFWLLRFREPSQRGIRSFELLSKQPLLNGHYVYGTCARACTFRTLRLSETVDETRPQMFLEQMLLTDESMFLCSSEELENGCDPAPEIFDQVSVMLGLVEDMFEAAQEVPLGGR